MLKQLPPIALRIFAGVLKWVFWLPMLTIYLADGRIAKHERENYGLLAGIGWLLGFILALVGLDPTVPMMNILYIELFFNLMLGAIVLLAADRDKAILYAA